jgi:hypothetical protein
MSWESFAAALGVDISGAVGATAGKVGATVGQTIVETAGAVAAPAVQAAQTGWEAFAAALGLDIDSGEPISVPHVDLGSSPLKPSDIEFLETEVLEAEAAEEVIREAQASSEDIDLQRQALIDRIREELRYRTYLPGRAYADITDTIIALQELNALRIDPRVDMRATLETGMMAFDAYDGQRAHVPLT